MTTLITTADFLRAYERGEISRFEAMRGIGVDGYRPFTAALLGCGFHLPRGSEEETDQEVADVLPILRRRLEQNPPQSPSFRKGSRRPPSSPDVAFS